MLDQIVADNPGRVTAVQWHTVASYPQYSAEGRAKWFSYTPPYGGSYATPWAWVDGKTKGSTGYDYNLWRGWVNTRLAIPASVTVNIVATWNPVTRNGTIMAEFVSETTATINGQAQIAITEDSINYTGPNGDPWHNHVLRDYIPDQNGTAVTIPAGGRDTVVVNFNLASHWVREKCNIVVYLQNPNTAQDSSKRIYQGAQTPVPLAALDVGATAIISPAATVDSGSVVTPLCSLVNFGSQTVSYQARLKIGAVYEESVAVTGHTSGSRRLVTFPNWNVNGAGTWSARCSTALVGDLVPDNDLVAKPVTARGRTRDVGCTRIVTPAAMVDSGTSVTPACTVYNYGNTTESYVVRFKIGSRYEATAAVTAQAPYAHTYLTFPAWVADSPGTHAVTCSTELTGDMRTQNDRRTGTAQVRQPTHDAACTKLFGVPALLDSGAVATPGCTLRNYGTVTETYVVRFKVGTQYERTVTITGHAPGTYVQAVFPDFVATVRGSHAVTCSTELPFDVNRSNDRRTGTVRIYTRAVAITRLIAPYGTIDSGTAVTPSLVLRNNGSAVESIITRFRIGTGYRDSVTTVLSARDSLQINARQWWASPLGRFAVTCSIMPAWSRAVLYSAWLDSVRVVPVSGVAERTTLPVAFALAAPSPNPFGDRVRLRYSLPMVSRVSLAVYAASGELVRTLLDGNQTPGQYEVAWDGCAQDGRTAGRGVYCVRLVAGDYQAMRKLIKTE